MKANLDIAVPPLFFLTHLTLDLGESWSPLEVLWESFAQMENNFCICCQASGNRFAYFFIIFPHLVIFQLHYTFCFLSSEQSIGKYNN